MGDIIVKIKDENVICELGKPVYSSNQRVPNFKCQFNATVIQVGGFQPVELSVVDGTTYSIPAGKLLLSIAVVPASGDRILSAGYTAGAAQILDSEEITSNDGTTFTVGRRFNTARTIHFSDYVGDLILYIL